MSTRRQFLHQASAGAAALALAPSLVGGTPQPRDTIDCHVHFYDPARPGGVPWPPADDATLYRTVLPREYFEQAAPLGIGYAIAVEASPLLEDNQYLLDLAEKEPRILGVVGRLDPLDADFPQHLNRFATSHRFRGIRISGATLIASLENPTFIAAMQRLAERQLSLDLNGSSAYLRAIPALARSAPGLTIIINHCGSPGDPRRIAPGWQDSLQAAAAAAPHAFCKVSGLPEQTTNATDIETSDPAFYTPILQPIWDAFGEKRILYGSNWPVCEKRARLSTVHRIAPRFFEMQGAQAHYLHANARRAYRLPQQANGN